MTAHCPPTKRRTRSKGGERNNGGGRDTHERSPPLLSCRPSRQWCSTPKGFLLFYFFTKKNEGIILHRLCRVKMVASSSLLIVANEFSYWRPFQRSSQSLTNFPSVKEGFVFTWPVSSREGQVVWQAREKAPAGGLTVNAKAHTCTLAHMKTRLEKSKKLHTPVWRGGEVGKRELRKLYMEYGSLIYIALHHVWHWEAFRTSTLIAYCNLRRRAEEFVKATSLHTSQQLDPPIRLLRKPSWCFMADRSRRRQFEMIIVFGKEMFRIKESPVSVIYKSLREKRSRMAKSLGQMGLNWYTTNCV